MPARFRRALRRVGRRIVPPPEPDLITQVIRRDARSDTYFRAIEFVNYEAVEGDVVECGVFSGLSLAILAKGLTFDAKGMARRVIGIDSFEGLPPSAETHARWQPGDCATVHAWHPLAAIGEAVSASTVRKLFAECGLDEPILFEGRFADVLPRVVPSAIPAVAILHVDCDLYESTREALDGLAPTFQDGTILLFDDWFHYKGRPDKGEARAFHEFLAAHPEWQAQPWRVYGTFCHGFILSRR